MKHNKYRKLGKNGAEVAPIGIGAMSFTNFYGPCNDEQADKVLTAALDLNLKHIDTSNIYGMGKSEERIGEFLSKQGKQANSLFNIATKASIFSDPETGKRGFNNEGAHLEEELDKSLKRMGVDCVDLFYQRWPGYPARPLEEQEQLILIRSQLDQAKLDYIYKFK